MKEKNQVVPDEVSHKILDSVLIIFIFYLFQS